jgi:serine/threonine-protein kinase
MLGSFGEIYLVDWGIAIALDDNEHAIPSVCDISSPAGTPAFMAPEMAGVKTEDFGPWTDVYLLGATLHFVLTGESRHHGKDLFSTMFAAFRSAPFEYADDVPDALAEICNRATHKEITERYQNAEELRRAVAEYRRHRASISVSKKALASLERFEALASEIETFGEEHLIKAYRLYGECRFGFEQALEIWPDNKDSLDGLERTVRTMIMLEIEQHNVVAARSLLQEIEDDEGALSQRLEELEQEIDAERKRIEALEAAERERDPRADRRQRGIAMVMLALSLALLNIVQVILTQIGWLRLDDWEIFQFKLVDLAISMLILTAIVVKVKLNDFGKNVIHALGFLMLAGVAIRFGGLIQGMTTEQTVIFESIFYTFFTMGVGLFSDRRLVKLGPLCLLSGVGTFFMPEYSWPIRVAVNLILLGCIGAIWTLHGGDEIGDSYESSS